MNKKNSKPFPLLCIIFFAITVLFTLMYLVGYIRPIRYNDINKKDPYISKNDWAFYNFGQEIKGIKGRRGVDINVGALTSVIKGTDNVVIAIVDTGIDGSCNELKDTMLFNILDREDNIDNDENGYTDDYFGWDFYNNDNSIYDNYTYDYHGTYIATTISRVAPGVKILPVKFLKSTSGTVEDAIMAIKYAIKRGARIINCSWNFDDYNKALYKVIKDNPDILFVCAAGNSNLNLDEENIYPCSYDLENIISVMAINNLGEVYKSSGYGKNVDIAAPGENVFVTIPENDETYINGTSVATAFVSSGAALILSMDSTLTPKLIKNIIIKSSKKLDTLNELCASEGCLDITNSIMNTGIQSE